MSEQQDLKAPNPGIEELKHFMQTLADESAKVIEPYFTPSIEISLKSDESPVTIADKSSENLIRSLITKTYPSHGILGEEFGSIKEDSEYMWVIDPIDGTKSFITGGFDFGTCVALLHRGNPILGMIHHPITHDTTIGDNSTTTRNGAIVKVKESEIKDCTLLLTDSSNLGQFQNPTGYTILAHRVQRIRTWGNCFGYDLLSRGYPVIMIDPIMSRWDIMALIPIIRGAGGKITDYQGGNPVSGTSIVASCSSTHEEIISILNTRFSKAPISELFLDMDISQWQNEIGEFVRSHQQQVSTAYRMLDLQTEIAELFFELDVLSGQCTGPMGLGSWGESPEDRDFDSESGWVQKLYCRIMDEIGDTLFCILCLVNEMGIQIVDFFEECKNAHEGDNAYVTNGLFSTKLQWRSLRMSQADVMSFEKELRRKMTAHDKGFMLPNQKRQRLLLLLGKMAKSLLKSTNYGKVEFSHASNEMTGLTVKFIFCLVTISVDLNINLDLCLFGVMQKYRKRFQAGKTFGSENEKSSTNSRGKA